MCGTGTRHDSLPDYPRCTHEPSTASGIVPAPTICFMRTSDTPLFGVFGKDQLLVEVGEGISNVIPGDPPCLWWRLTWRGKHDRLSHQSVEWPTVGR